MELQVRKMIKMENDRASSSSSDLKKASTDELLRGRDLSNQLLQLVLHHRDQSSNTGSDHEGSLLWIPCAQDLVNNILTSFSNTLLLFDSLKIPTDASPESDQKHHDLDHHTLNSLNTRNGRRCYLRKRAMQTCEEKSPILVDDGHAWRKYGQKKTMNAKYLRNYYRCSHEYGQGCPAMKQVQRIREKPPLHRTTYFGSHTCNNHQLLLPVIPLDHHSSRPSESSLLLSFNDDTCLKGKLLQDQSFFLSTKKEEETSNDHHIVKQTPASQSKHVTTTTVLSSSTLDQVSSVKPQSIELDDVILKCFDYEFVHFGP
ncbi:probable WRKY transcription factor 70 [Prosopis cineraria]|uniref:probable WRKY transcription factor 70 n=1 Tax=Prosopis cineraria TaxID=364024 RepID=UPI00240EA428|nr:probable WRKY transcription factor 70 [Prosopis cineraria]